MIKIEHTDVYGWEAAIRGLRNPMNSWDKSDSCRCEDRENCGYCEGNSRADGKCVFDAPECSRFSIGANDLKLMKSLSKAGNDHSKFLRMINVTVDITAPLYWWKEFETYRAGVAPLPMDIEMNSCSTMHKIHAKEFTLDDFSHDHLHDEAYDALIGLIYVLNDFRRRFIQHKDKSDWWQMIQLLPTSYNQKRTVQLNYQVLKAMYKARWNHKLDEWVYLCEWMHELPYFKEICTDE